MSWVSPNGGGPGVTSLVGGSAASFFVQGGGLATPWRPDPAVYAYTDTAHVHAVTSVTGLGAYAYDANGNMTGRVEGGTTYTQTFDVENRLVSVAVSGGGTTQYQYDAGGQMLKKIAPDGTVTVYLGLVEYELIGGAVSETTSYYNVPGARVVRTNAGLSYVLTDHLGSSSVTLNANGDAVGERRYYAYGETRVSSGTIPTERLYTSQLRQDEIGLDYYNSRWYLPYLNRWLQPDTIVPHPTVPQSLNRYSYANNNPIRFNDPSGHCVDGFTTLACILIGIGVVLKVVDYGWTAYDAYQSSRMLADPNASTGAKLMAGLNVSLAVIFEAAEPDDLLPAGVPLDDVARRAVMKGARDAYEAGGQEAFEKFLREQLGEHTDDVFQKLGLGRAFDPKDISHVFDNPRHGLDDLLKSYGSRNSAYGAI